MLVRHTIRRVGKLSRETILWYVLWTKRCDAIHFSHSLHCQNANFDLTRTHQMPKKKKSLIIFHTKYKMQCVTSHTQQYHTNTLTFHNQNPKIGKCKQIRQTPNENTQNTILATFANGKDWICLWYRLETHDQTKKSCVNSVIIPTFTRWTLVANWSCCVLCWCRETRTMPESVGAAFAQSVCVVFVCGYMCYAVWHCCVHDAPGTSDSCMRRVYMCFCCGRLIATTVDILE